MSEFRGTPGPWEINNISSNEGKGIAIDADHPEYGLIEICEIWGAKDTDRIDDEAKANANLIAAATDLLECCMEFVRKVENGEARSKRSYAQMKAAIAKALGEQP